MNANKNEQPNEEPNEEQIPRLPETEKKRGFAAEETVWEVPQLLTRSTQGNGGAVVQLFADDKTDSNPLVFIRG